LWTISYSNGFLAEGHFLFLMAPAESIDAFGATFRFDQRAPQLAHSQKQFHARHGCNDISINYCSAAPSLVKVVPPFDDIASQERRRISVNEENQTGPQRIWCSGASIIQPVQDGF
jgi:hypothetical protein